MSIERRFTLRMLSYWEKLRKNMPMPVQADVKPGDIEDLWENCFLLYLNEWGEVDHDKSHLGKNIRDAYRQGLNEDDDPVIISPDIARFMQNHRTIFEVSKPLLEEGEFANFLLGTVKYRQCLLPLGENGRITAILGGMHFKNFLPVARPQKIVN